MSIVERAIDPELQYATIEAEIDTRTKLAEAQIREQDLAARGITLRRRTGGSDAGWHLKLPAGPDSRTEL